MINYCNFTVMLIYTIWRTWQIIVYKILKIISNDLFVNPVVRFLSFYCYWFEAGQYRLLIEWCSMALIMREKITLKSSKRISCVFAKFGFSFLHFISKLITVSLRLVNIKLKLSGTRVYFEMNSTNQLSLRRNNEIIWKAEM